MRLTTKLIITIFFILTFTTGNGQKSNRLKSISIGSQFQYELGVLPDRKIRMDAGDFNPVYFNYNSYRGVKNRIYYKQSFAYILERFYVNYNYYYSIALGPHGSPPHKVFVYDKDFQIRRTCLSWQHEAGFWWNESKRLAIELGIGVDLSVWNHFRVLENRSHTRINDTYSAYSGDYSGPVTGFDLTPNFRAKAAISYVFRNDKLNGPPAISIICEYVPVSYTSFIVDTQRRRLNSDQLILFGFRYVQFLKPKI